MPLLKILTNQSVVDEAKVLAEATEVVSTMLGKSASYVQIILEMEQKMSFAGSLEPCAYMELHSLGLDESQTESMSASLCAFVEGTLGVAANRTYIQFQGPARHLWGWNSKTFA